MGLRTIGEVTLGLLLWVVMCLVGGLIGANLFQLLLFLLGG